MFLSPKRHKTAIDAGEKKVQGCVFNNLLICNPCKGIANPDKRKPINVCFKCTQHPLWYNLPKSVRWKCNSLSVSPFHLWQRCRLHCSWNSHHHHRWKNAITVGRGMIANYNCSSVMEHGMSSHVLEDGEENLVLSLVLNNVLLTNNSSSYLPPRCSVVTTNSVPLLSSQFKFCPTLQKAMKWNWMILAKCITLCIRTSIIIN